MGEAVTGWELGVGLGYRGRKEFLGTMASGGISRNFSREEAMEVAESQILRIADEARRFFGL